jgi:hypothetical protein
MRATVMHDNFVHAKGWRTNVLREKCQPVRYFFFLDKVITY